MYVVSEIIDKICWFRNFGPQWEYVKNVRVPIHILLSITNKMQRYTIFFITVNLYMFQVFPPIIRSSKTVHTAYGLCCVYSFWAPDDGQKNRLRHVELENNKEYYTECPRRNGQNFGRVFPMLNYTDITQNTYIQSWMVTEIIAREVWNFDSCYTLIDYQIHIKTGRNMWFL